MLCQKTRPSQDLIEHVRCFIVGNIRQQQADGADEAASFAKRCLADLNLVAGAAHPVGKTQKTVRVLVFDYRARKVHYREGDTVDKLAVAIAEELRANKKDDFGFYQRIDGLPDHRRLSSHKEANQLFE